MGLKFDFMNSLIVDDKRLIIQIVRVHILRYGWGNRCCSRWGDIDIVLFGEYLHEENHHNEDHHD